MKLTKLHLFLILLLVLLLSSLGIGILEGYGIIEGNENIADSTKSVNSPVSSTPVSTADPNASICADGACGTGVTDGSGALWTAASSALSRAKINATGGDAQLDENTIKHTYGFNVDKPDVRVAFKKLGNEKKPMGYGSASGIEKDAIPPGDEHLYVLKSEMVPPVCPKCPEMKVSGGTKEKKNCPPCPAPQRCPVSAFACKKVPNYSASSVDNILPSPMFQTGSGTGSGSGAGAGSGSGDVMPILNSFAKFS